MCGILKQVWFLCMILCNCITPPSQHAVVWISAYLQRTFISEVMPMPPATDLPNRTLLVVACVNTSLHAVGLVCALFWMRPGTPALPLVERMEYLAGTPFGWQLSWGVWMLCVPAVIAFFYLSAERLKAPLARLALGTALAAGTIDLCCDTIFLLVYPASAARGPEALFLTVEQATSSVSLIVANGFYSIASLLLTVELYRRNAGAAVVAVGCGVVVFGTLLAVAGFTGVPWHIEWATGPTIGLYCAWTILTARAIQTIGADA
jgi:hypothetical protein